MSSNAFRDLLVMSCAMGVASFGVGILPMSFTLSKNHMAKLSTFGTGLLVGAALGVIIPEGIEVAVANNLDEVPTSIIALSMILGFTFMLFIEQYAAPHARPLSHQGSPSRQHTEVHFDIDLEELEQEEGLAQSTSRPSRSPLHIESIRRAYPLSIGLVVHGLVDGYALGVSALHSESPNLSLVVFLAIIIHKAPTALALTTSLLALSLPLDECRKHLTFFSLSTPIGAILSYTTYYLISSGQDDIQIGSALLFSGGTFLYVATVLQPVSEHSPESSPDVISKMSRTLLLVAGMFLPLVITSALGRDHH
ncbi:hypothetical protein SERLA73DRAFT_91868 [Serpula lacrymans var. lacrymans S7.3]|uniref:Zinc/iron permease n=2 Tax=Serpula lacrymans var. lacrymans TaxID=341189 RepID=F8Q010_SERL3|nr:uncharacterized protein SERLADRAFT_450350 [Serpula lacrymans var. lacrymans S7.9]EGN98482.1 hypothetical protein SERLA73DRAFT_91868 [Serpula lacrymans var. lacrymans S7.3]EGO24059.1 hypothetical protein SERLADRAFT_450350 [Serpula lacrymans var. lacrymans S7.9]